MIDSQPDEQLAGLDIVCVDDGFDPSESQLGELRPHRLITVKNVNALRQLLDQDDAAKRHYNVEGRLRPGLVLVDLFLKIGEPSGLTTVMSVRKWLPGVEMVIFTQEYHGYRQLFALAIAEACDGVLLLDKGDARWVEKLKEIADSISHGYTLSPRVAAEPASLWIHPLRFIRVPEGRGRETSFMQSLFRSEWRSKFYREVIAKKARYEATRAACVHKETPAVEEVAAIADAVHMRSVSNRRDDWLTLGEAPLDVAKELADYLSRPAPYAALNHFLTYYQDFFLSPDLDEYVKWLLQPSSHDQG